MTPPAPSASRVHDVNALPVGTRLGEFELLSVLGVGGFGIVYLAFDHALEREVAVKEYMPASLAGRTETLHVSLRSQSDAETFALGLRSFVNEARLLARFDHPSLLKVLRFWEANGTAYMAMPVMRGHTLKELRVEQGRAPDEATLRTQVQALLGALERLHGEGVYHRDIAPDNIQIEPDGHPVLLDFGAARRVLSDKTQTLTAILKPAYAPIEQYAETGSVKQGPWTDFYALGATLHYVLLGRPPAPATARAVFDESAALAGMGLLGYSPGFLQMVDWMLAPRPADRPQNVAELRQVLQGERQVPAAFFIEPDSTDWDKTQVLPRGLTGGDDATLVVPRTVLPSAPAAVTTAEAQAAAGRLTVEAAPPAAAAAAVQSAQPSTPPVPPTPPTPPVQPLPPAQPQASAAPVPKLPRSTVGAAALPPTAPRKSVWPLAAAAAVALAVAGFVIWPKPAPSPAPVPTAAESPAPAPAAMTTATPQPAAAVTAVPAPTAVSGTSPAASAAGYSQLAPAAAAAVTGNAAAPVRAAPESEVKPITAGSARPPPRTSSGQAVANKPAVATAPAAVATEASTASPPLAAPAAGATAPPPGAAAATPPPPAARPPAEPTATPAAAAPAGPEAKCNGRNPIAYFVCMERECLRGSFSGHADCQAWRKEAKRE